MTRWLAAATVLVTLAGCDGQVTIDDGSTRPPCKDGRCGAAAEPIPPVDLPEVLRQGNYGGGSCMHAALISILRWQGRADLADQWRRTYGGAAGVWDLAPIARRLDLDYAWTTSGDVRFLDWCSDTRRGAAIHYKPGHALAFFGFVERGGRQYAVINDNNAPARLEFIERERFLQAWRGYGGCALTIVGTPGNPRPRI